MPGFSTLARRGEALALSGQTKRARESRSHRTNNTMRIGPCIALVLVLAGCASAPTRDAPPSAAKGNLVAPASIPVGVVPAPASASGSPVLRNITYCTVSSQV